jgi:hypothetical protein
MSSFTKKPEDSKPEEEEDEFAGLPSEEDDFGMIFILLYFIYILNNI